MASGVPIATFADDTSLLASNKCFIKPSQLLENNLNEIKKWLARCRIAASVSKSVIQST